MRDSYDDFEKHRCPKCDLVIWKTHMQYSDGTAAECPECGRLKAIAAADNYKSVLQLILMDDLERVSPGMKEIIRKTLESTHRGV